jgi:hypothetical protein
MDEAEVDMRPRRSAEQHQASALGGVVAAVDASRHVAIGLLALLFAELLLRALSSRRRSRPRPAATSTTAQT